MMVQSFLLPAFAGRLVRFPMAGTSFPGGERSEALRRPNRNRPF
jgi:hypothetical protein